MYPSQIRTQILREHVRLRQYLDALEAAACQLDVEPAQLEEVAGAARRMLEKLVAHTQLEDSVVAPALREIDAWGMQRASMLLAHHEEQRELLRRIIAAYEVNRDPQWVRQLTLAWAQEVRIDMQVEEREILDVNLFRDDPVAVDMECG